MTARKQCGIDSKKKTIRPDKIFRRKNKIFREPKIPSLAGARLARAKLVYYFAREYYGAL